MGHACGPGLGSEPGFTWNFAQALSAKHQVWVLAYPQHRPAVERFLAETPNRNLNFHWVVSNHPLDPWKPERGERGIRIHYVLWVAEAYRQAEELCRDHLIDVVHHISLGTVGAPPPLWRLPVPALWGPIGGGQTTHPRYLPYFGRQRWAERIRTARVNALRFSWGLRRTARHCHLIFATNRETAQLLKRVGSSRVEILLDACLPVDSIPAHVPNGQRNPAKFTLLWAGRLEHRKGLMLGLQALTQVKRELPLELLVAGSGPQEAELKSLVRKLGLESRVTFLGSVPFEHMSALFARASVFLFTSLRDSFGSVVLEAMAQAVPILTLNHQGVGTLLPDAAAIKVDALDPQRTIDGLVSAIERLAASPEMLDCMRTAAWEFAREQVWSRRAESMSGIYEKLYNGGRQLVAPGTRPA